MSHVDTLKVYKEYKIAGFSDDQSEKMTDIIENSFMTEINSIKSDFASNKLMIFFGTIIIAIGGFTLNKVWDLSHDLIEVKSRLSNVEANIK